jgi:predicted amidohydrolase
MTMPFEEQLRVGVIQTTVDNVAAWSGGLSMSKVEEERAIAEIQQHLAALNVEDSSPQIILLPEVSVPLGFMPRLRRAAATMNAIIIAGLDFEQVPSSTPPAVRNRAAVIIPNRWGSARSSSATVRYVGKTYSSFEEGAMLRRKGFEFHSTPEIWVFDAGRFGRFGVVICFDLLDLERVAVYRMELQHLFVLAYNKDTSTFDHAAEALARMIYCNIVICNTGQHGGSIAVSPYKLPQRRMVYRHTGLGLSTSQTIHLPVRSLILAQTGHGPPPGQRIFKALPPGSAASITQTLHQEAVPSATEEA